jgi:hypothetical protein
MQYVAPGVLAKAGSELTAKAKVDKATVTVDADMAALLILLFIRPGRFSQHERPTVRSVKKFLLA